MESQHERVLVVVAGMQDEGFEVVQCGVNLSSEKNWRLLVLKLCLILRWRWEFYSSGQCLQHENFAKVREPQKLVIKRHGSKHQPSK